MKKTKKVAPDKKVKRTARTGGARRLDLALNIESWQGGAQTTFRRYPDLDPVDGNLFIRFPKAVVRDTKGNKIHEGVVNLSIPAARVDPIPREMLTMLLGAYRAPLFLQVNGTFDPATYKVAASSIWMVDFTAAP